MLLPTPPFGLATTITGMRASSSLASFAVMLAGACAAPIGSEPMPPAVTADEPRADRRTPRRCRHPRPASPTRSCEHSRVNRRLLQRPRAQRHERRRRARGARPVRALPRLPDRRRRRAGGARGGPARRLAAPDPLVRHAAADEAVGRRGARLRLGLRPRRHALRGKDLWLVASTGGAEDSYRPDGYNRYFFDAFLPPYEQTAALCGMRFLPPLVLHGAHRASDGRARRPCADLRRSGSPSYPDWPEIDDARRRASHCDVPADAPGPTRAASMEAA